MIKTRVLSLILVVITLCGICMFFAGCPEKDKRKDIIMKVICREWKTTRPIIEEWIFPPDVDSMEIDWKYDGKEYFFSIYEYRYLDDNTWYTADHEGLYSFSSSLDIRVSGQSERVSYIFEKGRYIFYADNRASPDRKARRIRLFINVI